MDANILLVDDSDAVRNVLKIYLMGLQRGVLEARRADEGMGLLERQPVSLVIADLQLPDTDGFAFCQRIRASLEERIRRVPLVLLTSEKTEALRQRAASVGADELILKPVTAADLQASVRRLLSPDA